MAWSLPPEIVITFSKDIYSMEGHEYVKAAIRKILFAYLNEMNNLVRTDK